MKVSDKSTNSQRKLVIRNISIKIAGVAILIGCAIYEPLYRAMVVGLILLVISEM